jgi:hypothetical protein
MIGWRRLQVDRVLAFAFVSGFPLEHLEPRLDALVSQLGGVRDDEPSLPYYLVPARRVTRS